MQEDKTKKLINKANKLRKKFNWLDSIEFYTKAYDLALNSKNIARMANFQEEIGYNFYRAAFQAKTSKAFIEIIKKSIHSFEKASELYSMVEANETKIRLEHSNAMVFYTKSWLEKDAKKMGDLLKNWWKLKKDIITKYESANNFLEIGRNCNDLIEYSFKNRFHLLTDWEEIRKATKEHIELGEKAISALYDLDDKQELARAYCWTAWYYCFSASFEESKNLVEDHRKKSKICSNKALSISKEIADHWLIGWSNHVASFSSIVNGEKNVVEYSKDALRASKITRDKHLIAETSMWLSKITSGSAEYVEDPEKVRELLRKAAKWAKKALACYRIIQNPCTVVQIHSAYVDILRQIAMLEPNIKRKRELLRKTINIGKELWKENDYEITIAIASLSTVQYMLSKIISNEKEKKQYLLEAKDFRLKYINNVKETVPFANLALSYSYLNLALIKVELARTEKKYKEKCELYQNAVFDMENSISNAEKQTDKMPLGWRTRQIAKPYFMFGELLIELFSYTKEEETLNRSIDVLKKAIHFYSYSSLKTREAESNWQLARVYELKDEHFKASEYYLAASKAYDLASQNTPQLREFYYNYSLYMKAWSLIEQAKQFHKSEKYDKSEKSFLEAANSYNLTTTWSYLAQNYLAWANMEKAEGLSRKEKQKEAIINFSEALNKFEKTEKIIKKKINEINEEKEKEKISDLIKVSVLRQKYCTVRINIEKGKILDKTGDYSKSSHKYREAANNLLLIIKEVESREEKKELRMLNILCQAWEKLALAEETFSQEYYLEASEYFEKAKIYCYTKKTRLFLSANISFCKGLAAESQFQISLDNNDQLAAKKNIQKASTLYLQGGFQKASEYAKATLRFLDGYQYMNEAETEIDQEKRTKKYTIAEKLLKLSASSFLGSDQPEKQAQVNKLINRIKEEKSLAESLNDILHTPLIASSTSFFASPNPTSEKSNGLETFKHANIQVNLINNKSEVKVGESFKLIFEFVNTGREPALLTTVNNFIPQGSLILDKPDIFRIDNDVLNLKGKQLKPLDLIEVELTLQSFTKGNFKIKPKIRFLDEVGKEKFIILQEKNIIVKEFILPNRIPTGTEQLDSILFGGIPEGYAVTLTTAPCDEREVLIKNFLKTGLEKQLTVFHITTESEYIDLSKDFQSNYQLLLCNSNPKVQIPNQPNIIKLNSRIDLNNISISLIRQFRSLEKSSQTKKIACIDIISDILLHYKVETTRRWILQLVSDFKEKGFTLLAIFNSKMHPADQANAVIDLFDGQIDLYEPKDQPRCNKSLRIIKMRKQKFLENPICIVQTL